VSSWCPPNHHTPSSRTEKTMADDEELKVCSYAPANSKASRD
jgi:hypothetical protein